MNLTTSLILLISFALALALPTKEQIDGTFMLIGSHEINVTTYGTGIGFESSYKYQWFMSRTLKADWAAAGEACKANGMKLAEIQSEGNLAVFLRFLGNFHYVHNYYPRAYLGISKSAGNETWFAASHDNEIDFNLVVNQRLTDDTGKRCLIAEATADSAGFTDSLCDEENFYICETFVGRSEGVV
ncbi:unnamed protein product [Diamesa tonsa]